MKKIVSLILAALMLLSAVAFADPVDTVKNAASKLTTVISVSTDINYGDGNDNTDTSAEAATELWLKVAATGQIDVTVPLIVALATDIAGGSAATPDNSYYIQNNSSAGLAVTGIKTTEVTKKTSTPAAEGDQPMTMVAYTATPSEDQYKARLSVVDTTLVGKEEGKSAATYDLKSAAFSTTDTSKGGLFKLPKATSAGVGVKTYLKIDMATGKLSFVTKSGDTTGVRLLTIVYTVAIDTSDAIGTAYSTTPDVTSQAIVPKTANAAASGGTH